MAWSGDPDGIQRAWREAHYGSTTAYGGQERILEAMNKASGMMVSLDELNRAASSLRMRRARKRASYRAARRAEQVRARRRWTGCRTAAA